jgi:hypothetical protein
MGNIIAPAKRNPHNPSAKQVKMCVNHAARHVNPIIAAQFMLAPYAARWLSCESCPLDLIEFSKSSNISAVFVSSKYNLVRHRAIVNSMS